MHGVSVNCFKQHDHSYCVALHRTATERGREGDKGKVECDHNPAYEVPVLNRQSYDNIQCHVSRDVDTYTQK